MELILLKDVEKIGLKGDVVRVKDGFARNYLLPRGLALVCEEANRKHVEELKVRAAKRFEKGRALAEQKAEKLKDLKIQIEAAAGEQGKLFGSVTAEDIREALEKKGHSFDKKHIHLKEAIRTLGAHSVIIDLFPQVKASLAIEVTAKA